MSMRSVRYASVITKIELSNMVMDKVLDNFLLHYCDKRENLSKLFVDDLKLRARVSSKLPDSVIGYMAARFIAHKLFRAGGYAATYRTDAKVLARSAKELEYLDTQIRNPWRYTFCSIVDSPHPDFYTMKDALTDATFLLYSPAVSRTVRDVSGVRMFSLLICGDEECYWAYGMVMYFRSLRPADLLYMARFMDPAVALTRDVPALIDQQPLPFMLLFAAGSNPVVVHDNEETILTATDLFPVVPELKAIEEVFSVESREHVDRYVHLLYGGPPDFVSFYHDKERQRLYLLSSSIRGYALLRKALTPCGIEIPDEAQSSVTLSMRDTIHEILDVSSDLSPYDHLFAEAKTPESNEEMMAVNAFLSALIEALNKKQPFNVAAAAKRTGIPLDRAQQLAAQVKSRIRPKPPRKNLD